MICENKVEIDFLFEISWEVCNKVGGIYTVLSTKAKNLETLYKNKLIFIGPDLLSSQKSCTVFKESKTLFKNWREQLQLPYGIKVRVGRWQIPGNPIAILVDFNSLYACKNDFYAKMWELYGVDSLHGYGDYNEACMFSVASAIVIENFLQYKKVKPTASIIAHFNEWTTGMGLLYLKHIAPRIASIFTTHATSIGRSICGNGKNLYQYFKGYNGDQMASELNMESKHSLEKIAAHNADCFTTVSDITAEECEQLLEIYPHIVTPNGFEENFVPSKQEFKSKREKARGLLIKVANALTGAKLDDNTFIVATSGRCEYRNKGLDVFIDSINKLGKFEFDKPVLAYILVPAWADKARLDLQQSLASEISSDSSLDAPFITHYLHNFNEDKIVEHIQNGFFNNPLSDKNNRGIRIIYVPCYLNGDDGIINESYYDILAGMDATVFPSYYEPWGYTPLESVAFGIPTITTSLSGFGRWVLSNFEDKISITGVSVVLRDDNNYNQVCDKIAQTLNELNCSSDKQKKQISKAAFATAHAASWDYFIKYYIDAYKIALTNSQKRNDK